VKKGAADVLSDDRPVGQGTAGRAAAVAVVGVAHAPRPLQAATGRGEDVTDKPTRDHDGECGPPEPAAGEVLHGGGWISGPCVGGPQ
jgi:hypothetical protein